MSVSILKPSDELEYHDYLTQCSLATFEYTSQWSKIIFHSFGFKPYILISRGEQGGINGVLPLFKAKSIFATRLVSTPYAVQTPILAQDQKTHDARNKTSTKLFLPLNNNRLFYFEKKEEWSLETRNLFSWHNNTIL